VLELLNALSSAVEAQDLESAASLFWQEAILSGSSEEELAVDAGVPDFLRALFSLGVSLRWDWEEPVVRAYGEVAWFYCDAVLQVTGTKPMPYRSTGVIREVAGEWRFGMWNGAEPA
jgi:hypothetical protein